MYRRIAVAGIGTIVAVLAAAALAASAASAACPNEAFRTGPSALLPECRAYEMVTPVEKESAIAVNEYSGTSLVDPSGDSILFQAPSAYAGAQGGFPVNAYLAGRGAEDWELAPIGGPQAAQYSESSRAVVGARKDLTLALTVSKEALAPGAVRYGSNIYLYDTRSGSYTTVAALAGNEGFYDWSQAAPPFIDAADDWSNILIASNQPLLPDAPAGQPSLYEYREGSLHLTVAGGEPLSRSQAIPNQMSADGDRFFYRQANNIYLHRRGEEEPELVSEDENGNPIVGAGLEFVGATPDGEVAFFIAQSGSVYRFEASRPAGERVTDLTPPAEGRTAGVFKAYVGQNGTTAYFAAQARLTPDAEPLLQGVGADLYVWHGERGRPGAIDYIGKTENPNELYGPNNAFVSPNGRFFGFQSLGEVTPDAVQSPSGSCPGPFIFSPPGPCLNVFLYSLDTGRVSCATCTGSPESADSFVGGNVAASSVGIQSDPVLDDGSLFFETPNPLVARDSNGVGDVYRRRGDANELISTGTDLSPSTYIGASADGSDVFFQTSQPLVGQDIDRIADLYDARVDGGLAQAGSPAPVSCVVAGNCQAGATTGAPPARTGTAMAGGAGEARATCDGLAAKAHAARKRSHALRGRAKRAKGSQAKGLRKRATREARTATRLGRRAGTCTGGSR